MVKTISVSEARKHFAQIIEEVSQGGAHYILTKNNKEIVHISSSNDSGITNKETQKYLEEFVAEYSEALEELSQR